MSTWFGDADDVKDLSKKIRQAIIKKGVPGNRYSPPTVLRRGAKEVMKSVLHTTPIGEDGSNWWGQDKYYPMDKRAHSEGTLRRGWITDSTTPGDTEVGPPATTRQMNEKVERTEVIRSGSNYSIEFTNKTPYASDVEWGHAVVFGKDGVVRGYVPGQYYTRNGVGNSKRKMRNAMCHELKKQLEEVIKS